MQFYVGTLSAKKFGTHQACLGMDIGRGNALQLLTICTGKLGAKILGDHLEILRMDHCWTSSPQSPNVSKWGYQAQKCLAIVRCFLANMLVI